MTNGKVYRGFHNDKKVEEHCTNTSTFYLLETANNSFRVDTRVMNVRSDHCKMCTHQGSKLAVHDM